MQKIKTQVCILGAGAGGTGCTYRLIKNGIKTILVDKNPDFGGTAVFCGVDGWEPGVSLDGIHLLLKDELEHMENACHVVEVVPNLNIFDASAGLDWTKHSFSERPWGFSMPTGRIYDDTLKRCISLRGKSGPMRRFQFEPDCMRKAINNILKPYSENLTKKFGYTYKSCTAENGIIKSIVVSNEAECIEITADYFVDASGDIALARDAGCAYSFGTEGKDEFDEPS
ncbi:MAG: FAD-dependent oxidoreductase, partial [Clostridia bacterium]|nr:FAD-dependent oxidoreductase [Clostridia bacterium]